MALSVHSATESHNICVDIFSTAEDLTVRLHLKPSPPAVRRVVPVIALAGGAALVAVTPALVGMSWAAVGLVLAGVSVTTLLALGALWMLGLLVHTVVLTAALPGLTSRRALLLNLSGSAVSNLLPFGGAAGMGWGYVMTKAWKVPPTSFAAFIVISNAWNVIGKLLVGTALVAAALALGVSVPPGLHRLLLVGAIVILVLLTAAFAAVRDDRTAGRLGRAIDRVGNRTLRAAGSGRVVAVEPWILRTRAETSATVGARWGRLTAGVVAYLFLQGLLLGACLVAVGAHVSLMVVAVAFGIERLLTLVPLTPGGSGFAELGTVAILVALGGAPVAVAAGVLLYRFYSHLMEIPIGGLGGLVWMQVNRRNVRKAAFA